LDIVKDDEWGLYPNFNKDELKCSQTGLCFMTHAMMKTLQDIRNVYGKPMIITSAYRDVSHPVERGKPAPGEHTYGMAVDVLVTDPEAIELIRIAIEQGVKRIGVSQRGSPAKRFLHIGVGDRDTAEHNRFKAALWSY